MTNHIIKDNYTPPPASLELLHHFVQSIDSEIVDRLLPSRCVNVHINLTQIIILLVGDAIVFLLAENRTRNIILPL